MKKFAVMIILILSFSGCGFLEKTHEVRVVNDTFDQASIYLDGKREIVIPSQGEFFSWTHKIEPMGKSIKNVEEGSHTFEIRCNGYACRQSLFVNGDLRIMVSDVLDTAIRIKL